jgi:lipopolysaccharide heptosyltransferase II
MMAAERDWTSVKHIVCFRLDTLGDVLMTTPAIRALKEAVPGRRITLVSSEAGAAAASLVPEIDHVLTYQAPWLKATPQRAGSQPDHAWVGELRNGRFDAAVIFTVFSQSALPAALVCYLADIPRRLAHCRENPYQLLTDWIPDPEPQQGIRHEVQRQLDLVAAVGARIHDPRIRIRVRPEAIARTQRILSQRGVDASGRWVTIHPGATAASRRYPPEHFAVVVAELARRGHQIVFTGTGPEVELVQRIASQARVATVSLAGELSLEQLAAVIELSPVLISNNSGPVHLAAAVGTPVVDLYALTNPQHTPWRVPHRVLSHDVPCRNCFRSVCPEQHHDCLRLLSPQMVVAATLDLLDETSDRLRAKLA